MILEETKETKDITFEQQGIETDKLTARTALRNLEIAKKKNLKTC